MRLKDKVCVITGAASGLGKTAVNLFLKEGAIVIACDLNEKALEKLKNEISSENLYTKVLDVTNRNQVFSVVEEIIKELGRIDVLINNAGITRDAMIERMSEKDWDMVIEVNLKGVFNMTQAVVNVMYQQGKGSIINTSSVVGIYGNIGQTNYAASKAGIIGLTKTWAKEFARKGKQIRVNAVAPGFIETPMTENVPDKVKDYVISRTPLKRMGKPEEVAYLYLFLASDESSFITGQVIGVDGGLTL